MNFNKIRKILGYGSSKDEKLKNPLPNIAKFIESSFNRFILNLRLMAKKLKDLPNSNLKLGKKYYRRGNFSEAVFRFTILTMFWPDHHEGHFMLAKSLLAQNKFKKAEKVLNKLVRRKPVFKDRAIELLYGKKPQ
jgi:tetratricopeptide (TPR) repeat protein